MALKSRVSGGGGQHHGREHAYAVGHAHQVHANHPFPVLQGVFPDQAARAHARVIEHKVRRTKARQGGRAQGFDLVCLGHVHAHGQHWRASGGQLGGRAVQRVLLHIGQHHIHAQRRANTGAFQAKARTSAGDHGGFVFEVRNHAKVSLKK